ncbi:sulfotransferase family protein [Microvirga massiliensis]|uniref:sulfotransferase family protein n=1 Tax=Microvirga massiliensis TaxID=1033741 RepID=UPI00062B2EC1|nr:sulfotransferase [Microvirga massiliensis]
MLPNLIIIGAMKSATSSLHYYLRFHPDISMSHQKELNFFAEEDTSCVNSKSQNKGLEWYKSNFNEISFVRGESSPSYTFYPRHIGVPRRMHSVIPNAKLIYIVRDPIERMLSHYVHNVHRGRERRRAEDALLDPNEIYLAVSSYYMQIAQFLNYYPRQQILIVSTEELFSRRLETLKVIFNYLGVHSDFHTEKFAERRHLSSSKRRRTLAAEFLFKAGGVAKKYIPISEAVRSRVKSLIEARLTSPIERPELTDDLRREIASALSEDVAKFRRFAGREFGEWKWASEY